MAHEIQLGSMQTFVATVTGFVLSKIFLFLNVDRLSDVASIFTILAGAATLFINWPRIKQRVIEIIQKYKR